MTERTFDRRVYYDERSRNFPIRTLVAEKPLRSYTWSCPVRLDQFREGACVGFAWMHEFAAKPKAHPAVDNSLARNIYHDAQLIDAWDDTPPEEGTSVLAGAQQMQKGGYLGEYRWCFSIRDLQLAVGYAGPVVLGIWWWTGMMEPGSDGFVTPSGIREGGHAILCNAFSRSKDAFRLTNSWGGRWGAGGGCYVNTGDMEKLLLDEGEACVPTVRKWVSNLR